MAFADDGTDALRKMPRRRRKGRRNSSVLCHKNVPNKAGRKLVFRGAQINTFLRSHIMQGRTRWRRRRKGWDGTGKPAELTSLSMNSLPEMDRRIAVKRPPQKTIGGVCRAKIYIKALLQVHMREEILHPQ